MRTWALRLLQCLKCSHSQLESGDSSVLCPGCGTVYAIRDGIADFLYDVHPIVQKEKAAVELLSSDPHGTAWLREHLAAFENGQLSPAVINESEWLRHVNHSSLRIEELLKLHPLVPGETVLEIGADHGWTTNILLDHGCRVIASDITNHMLLFTRPTEENLQRIYADMNRLPLQDNSVDVVWATSAIHHSWDLQRTLREVARVLRSTGKIYLCCEPMPSLLRYICSRDFGHKERELGINDNWIRRGRWLSLCRRAGFEPTLVFPKMKQQEWEDKLQEHHIPAFLGSLLRLFADRLTVSISLVARKH